MGGDVTVRFLQNLQHEILIGEHRLVADEPREVGGDDAGQILSVRPLVVCEFHDALRHERHRRDIAEFFEDLFERRSHAGVIGPGSPRVERKTSGP